MDKEEISLITVLSEIKKVSRKIDGIQKSVDVLDSDREILEDIQGRLTAVEERQRVSRHNDDNVEKSIKFELGEVREVVNEKTDEIKNELGKKKIITVKKYPKWMFWRR